MDDIITSLFSGSVEDVLYKLAQHLDNYETQLTHPKFRDDPIRKAALVRDLQDDIALIKETYKAF